MIADYYDGRDKLIADAGSENIQKISPSSIANFFSSTSQWYREHLLGESNFNGSTATILGTIIHHYAEKAALREHSANANLEVEEYLDKCESDGISFDRQVIESLWQDMSQLLINSCVTGAKFHSVEQFIFHKVLDGIYVGGTYDALIDNGNGTYTIRDYKNSGTKPSGISYNYRMQAHTYAYILTKMGYNISHIELQYVVRPTKTLPARHFEFKEEFTPEHLDKITSQIELIAESIDFWNKNPDKRHLIAQDLTLKPHAGVDYSNMF